MEGLYLITEKDIADDINDRIINVMKDYKSQIIISNNKLEQETKRRKEVEKFLNVSVNLHIEGLEESSGSDSDAAYLKKITEHIRQHQQKYKATNDS